MCGIAGIIDFSGAPVNPSMLGAMSDCIAHRGQDDEGYAFISTDARHFRFCSGSDSAPEIKERYPALQATPSLSTEPVAFAHRRFAIFDLSAAGHQPFIDAREEVCLIFNGEIYNYLELREELKTKGYSFTSATDTEVLLNGYLEWGTAVFDRLNGFWALALYDMRKQQVLLSRDRVGKKPLYWCRVGSRFYFASEIKALLAVPEIQESTGVNEAALFPWFAYSYRNYDTTTFFKNISLFPAGSWAKVGESSFEDITTFWRPPASRLTEKDISPDEAAGKIRELLSDAVKIRTRADVPWGVELSGGMDSSSILVMAAEQSTAPVKAYTVKWSAEKWNEEPYARQVAEKCGADYHPFEPPVEGFWQHVLPFTYLQEEPYHSPNLQTNQVIWTLLRSSGAKVSLSGCGGDEIFAGYPMYYELAQLELLRKGMLGSYFRNASRWTENSSLFSNLLKPIIKGLKRTVRAVSPALTMPGRYADFLKKEFHAPFNEFRSLLSDMLYQDFTRLRVPYWLNSIDKSSMGIPFEVRSPFLDYRIVELGFSLPVGYLVRDGWHKWILRKAVEDLLPHDVVWRKTKMGFPFDLSLFLQKSEDALSRLSEACSPPYFKAGSREAVSSDWKSISFLLWHALFIENQRDLLGDISSSGNQHKQLTDYGYEAAYLSHRF